MSLARRCRRHIYTLLPTIELGFQLFPSRLSSDAHALQKSLTDIVQISILIQIKKIIFKGKKPNKIKEKETELSGQIPFSSPSAFPNGFSPLSSRREVKSKTKTNRVHGCVACSTQIGEFQDLPLRLVVTPSPPCPILASRVYRVLDRFPQVQPFNSWSSTPERVNSVISGPHFLLTVLLKFISMSYSLYRLEMHS